MNTQELIKWLEAAGYKTQDLTIVEAAKILMEPTGLGALQIQAALLNKVEKFKTY